MTTHLMLDSGAFSVWSKGHTIDLSAYTEFCQSYSNVSYYVSLDVIPGKINARNLTKQDYEDACTQGWKNYQKLLKKLPFDKVIPVYHQGDQIKWLHRYIEFGTPYIGISPANDQSIESKKSWLRETRKHVLKDNKPIIKTHGFGFSQRDLLETFPWYSVDCATWAHRASLGEIWIPRRSEIGWDYSKPHMQIGTSFLSSLRHKRGHHYLGLPPVWRKLVDEYVTEKGFVWGTSERVKVGKDYKRQTGEAWLTKGKLISRPVVVGLSNCAKERMKINILYIREASKYYPLTDFYLAGHPHAIEIEKMIHKRLLSFAFLSGKREAFEMHHSRLGGKVKCG